MEQTVSLDTMLRTLSPERRGTIEARSQKIIAEEHMRRSITGLKTD